MPDKASNSYGRFEILPASQLTVIPRYQRTPTPARVNALRKKWDDDLRGLLQVAHITNGEYRGKHHVYEGGTRWAVKSADDPDYLFPCWIMDMSAVQAARRFLAENKESMKPSAFARYRVGTAAGEPVALAIEKALKDIPLLANEGRSTYGNGGVGEFSAFAAAERIVKRAYAIMDDWDESADHLTWTITMGRRAYPQYGDTGSAFGHDADIIQALSSIGLRNPRIVGDDVLEQKVVLATSTYYAGDEKFDRLFEPMQSMKPEHWRTAFIAKRGNMGGSESRGAVMQKLIIQNLHRNDTVRLKFDS